MSKEKKASGTPKMLFIDIETAPMLGFIWDLFDQNIALNQIKSDWHLLSFCAKWADNKELIYADQSKSKNIEDDRKLLEQIWKLLDEADIVVGQNIKRFDRKKINARFLMHGMKPPSSYRLIDTLTIMKSNFALTSNKLEYATDKLNKKYKKLKHAKFPGFSLWSQCLKGNKEAWAEMERYNKYDVLALEELYYILAPWDKTINFDVYNDEVEHVCSCGHKEFKNKGYAYTSSGKFKRYLCTACGKESRGKLNLLSKEKRHSLRPPVR